MRDVVRFGGPAVPRSYEDETERGYEDTERGYEDETERECRGKMS